MNKIAKHFLTVLLSILTTCAVICSIFAASCNTTTKTQSSAAPIASTTTTSVTSIPSNVIPSIKAPINIDKNSDGQTVRVNLVKFTGSISSPETTVLVNHNSVTIDSNGNYYIYLDLKKGQNTIEVKTVTGTETNTDNINIFFDPPLAIQLNFPNFDPNTDLKIPTTITGVVSNPTADVTVNGKKVDVKTDGSFTAQILSVKGKNHVDAIATSNNDNDETYLNWTMLDNGQLGYDLIPTSGPYTRPTVTLKAGESTSFDFVTQINTTISELNSLAVIRTEQLGDERTSLPILPDLIVSIEPSTFTAYRRIEYHSQITIKTSPGLKPRDYYFIISPSFGNMADFIISIK